MSADVPSGGNKRMKYDYVHRYLSALFQGLGLRISEYPLWFVIVPLIASGILSTGFTRVKLETNLEYLYTPINGRSKVESELIDNLFPRMKQQEIGRLTTLPPFASVIATPVDGGTVLREGILDEIVALDTVVRSIVIKYGNRSYAYQDICMRDYGEQCFSNDALRIRGKVSQLQRGTFKIKYPLDRDWFTFTVYPYNLGGVTVDDDGYALAAKAFRLIYFLDDFTEESSNRATEWMTEFLNKISKVNFDKIKITRITRDSLDIEANKITYSVYPTLILAAIVMIAFGAVSCLTSDWVTSKPWLGVAGCISSLLGTAGAFGMLLLFGTEYVDINIAIVFLMLGIGMDDSFVILAAWRLTDPKDSVKNRMSKAYSESAISVSITSLTNFLASCVGLVTPYRVIRIYSLYSAMAILFTYITQITFFGGCMALSGEREFRNRHAVIFCFPVKRNWSKGLLRMLVEGCGDVKHSYLNNEVVISRTLACQVFDFLGKMLVKGYVKALVLLIFLVYFSLGAYAAKNYLIVAFDYTKAFPRYSYASDFVREQYRFFSEYAFNFQLVINATLDYSDPNVQNDIEQILHTFESSPYVQGPDYTESWLREYMQFKSNGIKTWFFEKRDTNESVEFCEGLRDVFFKLAGRFKNDVRFNEDGSKIVASRFILPSLNLANAVNERNFINDLWGRADSCKYPVYLQNPYFFLYDISSGIEKTSVQCLLVTAALVIFVFVFFIPSFICAFSVSVTVVVIEVSLIGYISLWNVNLNIISMICLVVSVGLSVDYSAHISYAFISSKETSPNGRLRKALLSVGYPALQGSTSTVLGVIVLCTAPLDSLMIFFKTIFLVMIFSFFHAVLLIPVMLSLLEEMKTLLRKKPIQMQLKTQEVGRMENGTVEMTEGMLGTAQQTSLSLRRID